MNQAKLIKKLILGKLGLVLLFTDMSFAIAGGPYADFSESDLRMLPPFCVYWFKEGKTGKAKVEMNKKYGTTMDLQHLCPGLNALNHALKQIDKKKRKYPLGVAEGELGYVLKHHQQFPLRHVVLRKRGKVFEMQGEYKNAISDYEEALKLKPKYSSVYADLASIFMKMGYKEKASGLIEKGLKNSSKSKQLLRLQKKLNNQ